MVLLDLEKAFDTVLINGLLFKLISYSFPPFQIKVIGTLLLQNRTFNVNIAMAKSQIKSIAAGTP